MGNWFNRSLRIPSVKHSTFDMSNDYKSSIKMGALYPNYVEDTVPSDKFSTLQADTFLRLAPMVYPIMHRIKVRQNYFFVPFRLIFGDEMYEKFLNDEVKIQPIELSYEGSSTFPLKNTIIDYMGYQPFTLDTTNDTYTIPNPLALLSYLKIWRTWYADEVLDAADIADIDLALEDYKTAMINQSELIIHIGGGSGSDTNFLKVRPVSYTKDYFTAAQTQPQRGSDTYLMSPLTLKRIDGSAIAGSYQSLLVAGSQATVNPMGTVFDGNSALRSTTTIRDLWQLEQIQRFLEVDALFGTRTAEKLAGHWGVRSSDARLQMPRYVGGGESIIQVQEVTQTSASVEGQSPLGNLAGKATSFSRSHKLKYYCEEHGFMLGLLSIVPDNGYMTGNPRYFYKQDFYDFASPEFNNIGYQSVYNGEIFASNSTSDGVDLQEFAYQPRYSEYRQHRSLCTGDFRDSLSEWHLNRKFSELPAFNGSFVHVNQADTARIFADTSNTSPNVFIDTYTKCYMSRPISYMPSSMHL